MDLTHRLRALASDRGRAALGLGVVVVVAVSGTFAHWTDSANLTGTTFTSGALDVKLNGTLPANDNVATATLSMTNMIPGATTAEVVTLTNNGNVSFKWSLSGGLTGSDATTFATASAMKLTILDGGSKLNSGQTSTCTGGSPTSVANTPLTALTSTSLLSGQGPLAGPGTKNLCFQITFDSGAANSLQNKSALGATFTFSGTSDLS